MSRSGWSIAAALLLATPAYAQDKAAEVDKVFSFATSETPGCAVGVSQHGKTLVNRAYGLANLERKLPLTQASLFDIGSTQKQFTAAAMLLLVEDGRLTLSDDIRKHLPELPDYGKTVTIDNLLTHTGGIRDWTGMLPMAPEGTNVLSLILRQGGLNSVPGEEWSYSNSGFELAKEIVARASGMSFAEFTKKRLFEPLGMTSTAYVPDLMNAGANAAMGYQKDGTGWRLSMRLGTNRGGGAIASNVGDILIWNDALASGRLGKFVTAKIQEPVALRSGRKLRYARGLMVDSTPGGLVVSHSGDAAGYSAWMGRMPEHALAVTVLCNFNPVSATALGGRVADLFLPPVDPGAQRAAPVAAAGVDVSGRAGLYFDERTGEPMRLVVNDGRLSIANGPPLVPVSASSFRSPRTNLFFRSQDDFEIIFQDPEHFQIKSMEGQVTRYRRARPWTPTVADLQGVEGRYESRELGAVYEIVAGTNAITMRLEGAPEKSMELTPVERDTYMFRMMFVRFRRDANGKVTGFEYGNPLVRSIAFTRLGERTAVRDGNAAPVPGARGQAAAPATAAAPAPVAPATSAAPAPAAPPTGAAPAPAASAASTAPPLEGLTGEYEVGPGRIVAVTLEGGRLHGQPSGGQKYPLAYVSGTMFSVGDTPITLTFTLGADNRATAVVMRQNGRERTLPKVR